MKKDILRYFLWALCATVWAAVCFILPDFFDNPVEDWHTIATMGAYVIAISGASFGIIYLLGLNTSVAWITLPLFGAAGAAISYFRVAFHATITPMIIDATLHTNSGTIAGVVSWQLVAWIGVNVLIAVALVAWRRRYVILQRTWIHALAAVLFIVIYYNAHWHLKSAINQRYPYNIVHSFAEYKRQQQEVLAERHELPFQVVALPDSINVVVVLGEAMRADHLSLNGYARETCPRLAKRTNVVSLPHIYSEYTYTATSVPHIVTPADNLHMEWAGTYHSFVRTYSNCGFYSAWISNQDDGRTYTAFIHEADTIIFPNAAKSSYVFDPWYDEAMIPIMDSLIAKKHAARQLFVLHTIGSHWYYDLHVPSQWQVFQPLTTNRIITNNEQDQVVNSYDNTVVYLDVFLDSLITSLADRNAVLLYLSDHGEALGDDGEWLHAGYAKPLHNPACIIWYSDRYAQLFPGKIQALQANRNKQYRTDFFFHSVLSAVGIKAEGDYSSLDIFSVE